MWSEAFGIAVSDDLPSELRAFLAEYFSAWGVDDALPVSPVASVGLLPESQARSIESEAVLNFKDLPGLWLDHPARLASLGAQTWVLQDDGGLCTLDLSSAGAAEVLVRGSAPQGLLFIALCEVFRCHGWLTVHASAVVTPEGHLRAWLGRSGAGKSVRVLRSLAEGCQFVGEDRLWVRLPDLLVVPRDRRVRLRSTGLAVAGMSLQKDQAHLDPDGKLRFPLETLGVTPARPQVLNELEVLLGEFHADPLEGADEQARATQRRLLTVQALWESLGLPFLPAAQTMQTSGIGRLREVPVTCLRRSATHEYLAV